MEALLALLAKEGRQLMTVPVGLDMTCAPFHRIYGAERLPRLLAGYEALEEQYWQKDEGSGLWGVDRPRLGADDHRLRDASTPSGCSSWATRAGDPPAERRHAVLQPGGVHRAARCGRCSTRGTRTSSTSSSTAGRPTARSTIIQPLRGPARLVGQRARRRPDRRAQQGAARARPATSSPTSTATTTTSRARSTPRSRRSSARGARWVAGACRFVDVHDGDDHDVWRAGSCRCEGRHCWMLDPWGVPQAVDLLAPRAVRAVRPVPRGHALRLRHRVRRCGSRSRASCPRSSTRNWRCA